MSQEVGMSNTAVSTGRLSAYDALGMRAVTYDASVFVLAESCAPPKS